jgi:hypothetical protein
MSVETGEIVVALLIMQVQDALATKEEHGFLFWVSW